MGFGERGMRGVFLGFLVVVATWVIILAAIFGVIYVAT